MATSFSQVQIQQFKRAAKKLVRESFLTHSQALDEIAKTNGFRNWSLLVKHSEASAIVPLRRPEGARVKTRRRFYLHGDQDEDSGAHFYCARCDVFVEASHFEGAFHPGEPHGERYLQSLERWTRRRAAATHLWRPHAAVNLLDAQARSDRRAYEASRSPFHRWLLWQTGRPDEVGEFADDVRRDKQFPVAAATRADLDTYLARKGGHIHDALEQAWDEFTGVAGP